MNLFEKKEVSKISSDIYNDLNRKGKIELQEYASGKKEFEVRTFKGTGLAIAVLFDLLSEEKVSQLVRQIEEIGERAGVKFVTIGRQNLDAPYHGTVSDGKHNTDLSQRVLVYEKVKNDSRLRPVLECLSGLEIKFDNLIVNAKSILLATTSTPLEVLEARKDISEVFKDYGLEESKEKDPILYVTLVRLTSTPVKNTLEDYLLSLEKIRQQLGSNSITLKTVLPFMGSSIELIPKKLRPVI